MDSSPIVKDKNVKVINDDYNGIVIEKFPLLEKLLSFFKTENEVNPVLAGYIKDVLTKLIIKNKLTIWKYFQTYNENLDTLIKKCNNQSVSEILIELMNGKYGDSSNPNYIKEKENLIKRLIEDQDESNIEGRWVTLNSLAANNIEIPYFKTEEIISLIYQFTTKNPDLGLTLFKSMTNPSHVKNPSEIRNSF